MNLLMLYVILSVANVIIQTIKSIATIKCGKTVASIVNAIAYGLYTIVLVYTNADFPLWEKVVVTAICNLIGVFVVKLFEEKFKKDKLWKVEMTVPKQYAQAIMDNLKNWKISYSVLPIESSKYILFNIYCLTQKESERVKIIGNGYSAKFFVSETKCL